MKKLFLVSLSVVAFVACNKKSDDKPVPFQERVPEKLMFVEPVKGPMPTQAQIDEITATFNNPQKMILPPGDLIYPSTTSDLSAEDISRKEQALRAQDVNSYNMLKEIQSSCAASKPVIENTFPQDEESGRKIKQGDVYSLSLSANLTARSAACPMTSKNSASLKMVFEEWEIPKNSGPQETAVKSKVGISAGANAKIEYIIKKPEYQRLLNARGLIVDTNMSGLVSVVEPNGKAYAAANLAGTYVGLEKEIGYRSSVEMAVKGAMNGASHQRAEFVASAELKFPTFKVDMVLHTINEGERTIVSEVYLNGNKLTSQQQLKMLNREFPGIGRIDNSPLLKVMKH